MNEIRVSLIYLLISLGTLIGIKGESTFLVLAVSSITILSLLFFGGISEGRHILSSFYYISPLCIMYLVMGLTAHDQILFIQRMESAFLVTSMLTVFIASLIEKIGEKKTYELYLKICILFTLTTVTYKIFYGFWDRDIRFLINGPIVFGWMSGLCIIIALFSLKEIKNKNINLFVIILMLASILWSSSKGPIVGLSVVYLIYIFENRSIKNLKHAVLITAILVIFSLVVPSELFSRFLAAFDQDSDQHTDEGSIGIRIIAWESAWELFRQNIILGIGPTNFQTNSEVGFLIYPHNIFVELLAEVGLVGFSIFFITICKIFYKTTKMGKYIIIYFLVCMMFSGDISYLRFLIAFPLAMALSKNKKTHI